MQRGRRTNPKLFNSTRTKLLVYINHDITHYLKNSTIMLNSELPKDIIEKYDTFGVEINNPIINSNTIMNKDTSIQNDNRKRGSYSSNNLDSSAIAFLLDSKKIVCSRKKLKGHVGNYNITTNHLSNRKSSALFSSNSHNTSIANNLFSNSKERQFKEIQDGFDNLQNIASRFKKETMANDNKTNDKCIKYDELFDLLEFKGIQVEEVEKKRMRKQTISPKRVVDDNEKYEMIKVKQTVSTQNIIEKKINSASKPPRNRESSKKCVVIKEEYANEKNISPRHAIKLIPIHPGSVSGSAKKINKFANEKYPNANTTYTSNSLNKYEDTSPIKEQTLALNEKIYNDSAYINENKAYNLNDKKEVFSSVSIIDYSSYENEFISNYKSNNLILENMKSNSNIDNYQEYESLMFSLVKCGKVDTNTNTNNASNVNVSEDFISNNSRVTSHYSSISKTQSYITKSSGSDVDI